VERKPPSFTDAENRAMRHVLRGLAERGKWTQAETGKRLGVTQQAAAYILNKNGSFSRRTALALARLCGFDGPESMLADLNVESEAPAPGQWFHREIAAGHARRLGCDEVAIDRVVKRYGEALYMTRDAKWWVEEFIREDRTIEAERKAERDAATRSRASDEPPAPKRKRKKAS